MAEFPALTLWTDAYLADTRHLSTVEHGAYLLLLIEAWRRPHCDLPDDENMLARLAGLNAQEWEEIRPVVMEFWTHDGRSKTWKQKRLMKERDAAKKRSKSQKDKAAKRWENEKKTDAAAYAGECRGNASTATATVEEKEANASSSSSRRRDVFPMPDYADPQVWSDFLENRRKKRTPNTASAHEKLLRDIGTWSRRTGKPPGEVLRACTERGWAGIYDFTEDRHGNQSNRGPAPGGYGAAAGPGPTERAAMAAFGVDPPLDRAADPAAAGTPAPRDPDRRAIPDARDTD